MANFKPEDFSVEDCKVCDDIQDWVEKVKTSAYSDSSQVDKANENQENANFWRPYPEPLDSFSLGQSTWSFLHVST